MRAAPTLPPIPWQLVPITPLPEVYESNSAEVWALFDAAQRALEQHQVIPTTPPLRAPHTKTHA